VLPKKFKDFPIVFRLSKPFFGCNMTPNIKKSFKRSSQMMFCYSKIIRISKNSSLLISFIFTNLFAELLI